VRTYARVLFTGAPIDYRKELQVAFGDYVEAYEGTDNTSRARSAACIAPHPAGNLSGSWILWKIENRTRVRRTNMRKMVTSDLIMQAMNATAAESAIAEETPEPGEVATQQPAETVAAEYVVEAAEARNPQSDLMAAPVDSENAVKENAIEKTEMAVEEQDAAGALAVTTRSGRNVHRLVRYMQVTKVSREDWKMAASTIAIEAELRMLFKELKALHCVRRAAIKVGTKILKSHMFVVEKHLADGNFDKMKARLVADGRDQDAEMYPDKSSPTVAMHSMFTALGLASNKPWWIVFKIDIKGAFVQTPMKGEPVYMRIDPKISQYVLNMFPELGDMLEGDGCLYTLLLKAMYGCIQASALWYELIKVFLVELGFECSETD
jgi:hypothetical protein